MSSEGRDPRRTAVASCSSAPDWGEVRGAGQGVEGTPRSFCLVPAGALTSRLLGQQRSRGEGCSAEGVSLQAFLGQHPQLGAVLLGELRAATGPVPGMSCLNPALHAVLTLLAQLQPGTDGPGR